MLNHLCMLWAFTVNISKCNAGSTLCYLKGGKTELFLL